MKKMTKKLLVMLAAVTLLLTVAVSSTVAYLADATAGVVNTFQPASVQPQINEDFDGRTKTNVTITNTGKTDGYFRVAIVVTWRDAQGNIYPQMPVEGTDYTIILNKGTANNQWTAHSDGFYYYNQVLSPKEVSENLINSCSPVAGQAPEGYNLHVAIAAQGVQATGMSTDSYGAVRAFELAAISPKQ